MASRLRLPHQGKASTSPQWTSLGRAIEQGKIEMTEAAIEKVSGGRTPSNAFVVVG